MIISSEIENVEKVENWRESIWEKDEKIFLRAFARTRAKNSQTATLSMFLKGDNMK